MIGKGPADDHVHSTAGSHDARASIGELCQQAVARGLSGLCFTEHIDFDTTLPEYGYYDYDSVTRALEQAREQFAGLLEIRRGLEVDFEPRFLAEIPAVLARYPVDFLLGSVHGYQGRHFAHFRSAGDAVVMSPEALSALYRQYFADTRALIRSGLVDCLAHVDYPAKVGIRTPEGSPVPGYQDELFETVALAAESGVGLEINTKRSRAGAPLAAPEIAVRHYLACGGRYITLGSDTHSIDQLGDGLELGGAVLRRAGITYQTIYRNRRAEQHPLAW